MDDYPTTPEHYPASGAAARAALHQLIERLTDEEAAARGVQHGQHGQLS